MIAQRFRVDASVGAIPALDEQITGIEKTLITKSLTWAGLLNDSEVAAHETWFTLMCRAFCWWRCHSLNPGEDESHKRSILPSWY